MAKSKFDMFKAAEITMVVSASSIFLEGTLFMYNKLPANIFIGLFVASYVIFLISCITYNFTDPKTNSNWL